MFGNRELPREAMEALLNYLQHPSYDEAVRRSDRIRKYNERVQTDIVGNSRIAYSDDFDFSFIPDTPQYAANDDVSEKLFSISVNTESDHCVCVNGSTTLDMCYSAGRNGSTAA